MHRDNTTIQYNLIPMWSILDLVTPEACRVVKQSIIVVIDPMYGSPEVNTEQYCFICSVSHCIFIMMSIFLHRTQKPRMAQVQSKGTGPVSRGHKGTDRKGTTYRTMWRPPREALVRKRATERKTWEEESEYIHTLPRLEFTSGFPQSWKVRESHGKSWKSHGK